VTRKIHDVPPPPYYRAVREPCGNLDRWFVYDFLLPGTLLMHSGGRPVADAEGDMRRAVRLHSCQTVTPETETTTHYFFQQSRRVEEGTHAVAEALYKALLVAFEEDRAMITAQSQAIDADPGAPMLPLAMDAAVVRFRRLVAETIAAERGERGSAAADVQPASAPDVQPPASPAGAPPARDEREARSIA